MVIALTIAAAWAEPAVLYTGDPADALAAAARKDDAAAAAWSLSELRVHPPFVDGPGRVWVCSTVPDETVTSAVDAARRALGYSRLLEADDALDDALALAVCEPELDVDALWQVWFLKGIVATYQEDPIRAERAFGNARILDPGRGWDDAYLDGRDTFDRALVPGPGELRLSIVPDPGGAVRVDGRPATGLVGPVVLSIGTHYLQIGRSALTVRLDVEARGTATLVIPSLLPDELLAWPARPERWRDLDVTLRALVPGEPTAWATFAAPDLWWAPAPGGPYERV
ncbi:MAG: hypothetical protein ABMB14_21935, partial [Myxococcota bacterium]